MPAPRCLYHPVVPMRRVQGPKLVMYGKNQNAKNKYYRCSVAGCPFVATIEKKQTKQKSNHQRRDRLVFVGLMR